MSTKSFDNSHPAAALGLGIGGGNQTKLSAERKNKLREQATQKLARAYQLDEIACSVATMQSASALEEVAALVLKRNPASLDGKYVHFFHEKIPSRKLAESTNLDTLDEIISGQPTQSEALRTRATVKVFKEDYKGAAKDLTEALHVFKTYRPHQAAANSSQELQIQDKGNRRTDIKPDDDQQPSSLEAQLLFARAGVYLSIACLNVTKALEPLPSAQAKEAHSENSHEHHNGAGDYPVDSEQPNCVGAATSSAFKLSADEEVTEQAILEARKVVRTNAKKALRDYNAFIACFHYSPDYPKELAEEFERKVVACRYRDRGRWPAANTHSDISDGHKVYKLDELFTSTPPSDLPPYPPLDITTMNHTPGSAVYVGSTIEMVTYHPLLTDALHALLLCHILVQTSTKELQRHAHMVARLTRVSDANPIFQASRSPARADWIEVLRQGNNWIGLGSSWETLCSPTTLYPSTSNSSIKQATQKALPAPGSAAAKEVEAMENEAIHQESFRRALGDDRVGDEAMFRVAYQAHRRTVEADFKAQREKILGSDQKTIADKEPGLSSSANDGTPATSGTAPDDDPEIAINGSKLTPTAIDTNGTNVSPESGSPPVSPGTAHRRWAMDEALEYPILTERASAVSRWRQEAPSGAGGTGSPASRKKKKKPAGSVALSLRVSSGNRQARSETGTGLTGAG